MGKATGPDELPARILKECSEPLSVPITKLARRLLHQGVWPECWRFQWIQALYKKGAVHSPGNHRVIHLTCVIPKVVERVLASVLVPLWERRGSFGMRQFAYRKQDSLALIVTTWLLQLEAGQQIGIFMSDISAVFDRVWTPLLLEKVRRSGCGQSFVRF